MIPFLKHQDPAESQVYVDENQKIRFLRIKLNKERFKDYLGKENLQEYINPVNWPKKPLLISLVAGIVCGVLLSQL
jgi:hypothetical protein